MAWVVVDASANVLRIDYSEDAPQDAPSVEVQGLTQWPARTNQYAVLRLVDGAAVWVDPRPTDEQTSTQWTAITDQRDALLTASDWIVLKSIEQGAAVPSNWLTYRQALRDITTQADPFAIAWPTEPAGT